jgi:hypothetical protein
MQAAEGPKFRPVCWICCKPERRNAVGMSRATFVHHAPEESSGGNCGLTVQRRVPRPRGGSTSPLEKHADFLLALIELEPDLTLDEVVGVMRELTIPGSRTAVRRFFQRHKITFKKTISDCVRLWA